MILNFFHVLAKSSLRAHGWGTRSVPSHPFLVCGLVVLLPIWFHHCSFHCLACFKDISDATSIFSQLWDLKDGTQRLLLHILVTDCRLWRRKIQWDKFLPNLSFKNICHLFLKNPSILEENASQLLWTKKNGRQFYTIHEGWKWVHANWTNLPIKPRRHSDTLSHVRLRTVKLQWWTMTEPIRDPPDSPKRFSSGNNSYLWHQYAQTIFINHNWVTVERT